MKRIYLIIIIVISLGIVILYIATRENSTQTLSNLTIINLEKDYPKKEIPLQEIANISYIPLETKDTALLDDNSVIISSHEPIITANTDNGSIFVFNEQGKWISSFNHTGKGPEEYISFSDLYLTPTKKEIVVIEDSQNSNCNHFIYDLYGNFKQKIKRPKLGAIYSFLPLDEQHLLVLDYTKFPATTLLKENKISLDANRIDSCNQTPYYLLNAQTFEVIDSLPIQLPFRLNSFFILNAPNSALKFLFFNQNPFIFDGNDAWCNDIASDTIYTFNPRKGLQAKIVKEPTYTDLHPRTILITDAISNQYLLFHKLILKSNFDFKEIFGINEFPMENILLNRETGEITQVKLINRDWKNQFQDKVILRDIKNFQEKNLAFLLPIPSLKDALEQGELDGELKKLAEQANEEDNPILMKISLK